MQVAGDGDVAREIGQLSLNGEKIMDASVAPHSNTFPSFGPNESLFGGPVLPQQSPFANFPVALKGPNLPRPIIQGPNVPDLKMQGPRTMPGGPLMPKNPYPELGRKLLRWNGF